MARGGLSFDGIGYHGTTYKADNDVKAVVTVSGIAGVLGKAVTITGHQTAGFGNEGDPLLGAINQYETDGYMTVQDAGYHEFPGVSGSIPTPGTHIIPVVDGNGAVKASVGATGKSMIVGADSSAGVNTVLVLIG